MKWNEQDKDNLTRRLMQETVEKPSSDLNSRIMSMILKKATIRKAFTFKKPVSAMQFFLLLIVYVLFAAGGLYIFFSKPGETAELMVFLKQIFPIFLTVTGGVSFFILFGLLDEWLQQHGYKIPEE
ncbi:hypothetical protein [Massilibacteroides sp.]|uniref:hypothetical protein n=1 Tax=Massilibacteroides sp. TaxID=2034766 RepID=UPI00262CBD9E|nr:hypothetical protein [Massilibacteroides sp.]MDD4514174.1 hypothetical protein [Massilibacteroides sp.]